MSKTSIPTTMRNCATCRRWTGTAIPNAFCSWVEIDVHETGKCNDLKYAPKYSPKRYSGNQPLYPLVGTDSFA